MLKIKVLVYSIVVIIIFSLQTNAEGWTKKAAKDFFLWNIGF